MPCTPLMARSSVIKDDLTSTSALEPGKSRVTITRGGEISGNCEIGRDCMAISFKKTTTTESTMARTGRRMKVSMTVVFRRSLRGDFEIAEHVACRLVVGHDDAAFTHLAQAVDEHPLGLLEATFDDVELGQLGTDGDGAGVHDVLVVDDEDELLVK